MIFNTTAASRQFRADATNHRAGLSGISDSAMVDRRAKRSLSGMKGAALSTKDDAPSTAGASEASAEERRGGARVERAGAFEPFAVTAVSEAQSAVGDTL